jgi:flagellar assembly protein FliH
MSSSASPAPLPAETSPAKPEPQVVLFAYREPTEYSEKRGAGSAGTQQPEKAQPDAVVLAAAAAEREARAREAGRQQGVAEARSEFDGMLAKEREAMVHAVADFARERVAYCKKIEAEAVRLALSIARKVLHREAHADPLLLAGAVRVALDKMEGATEVSLLVAPQRAAEWHRYLSARMDVDKLPAIVEDSAMVGERCVLRTSMGTADFGMETQLKEIEQGLMDLLTACPKEKP